MSATRVTGRIQFDWLIEVGERPARRTKAAADFGERRGNEQRPDADGDDQVRAPAAGECRDAGRHREHGAADHLIDADRRQIPATELAPKLAHGAAVVS